MTPLLQTIVYLTIDAVKEELSGFLKQELAGATVNMNLLQKNLEMKVGKDLQYVVTELKKCMKDGKIDAKEMDHLNALITDLEV